MAASAARAAAFDALLRVERRGVHSDDALHSRLLQPLTAADRALATELVMGVLRWRARLDAVLAAASRQPLATLDLEVLLALRLAAYQLGFLDRVPQRAAVHESVELVKRARKRSAAPFTNAVLRRVARDAARLKPAGNPPKDAISMAAHWSHPVWLVERWVSAFGAEAAGRICEHNQFPPQAALWLSDATLEDSLGAEGVKLAPGMLLRDARRVTAGDIAHTRAFREGRLRLQDEASQLVAVVAGTGGSILDCCAAPGGKTAILAGRNPEALVVATDASASRLRTLRRLALRENVRIVAADAVALPFAIQFDRILADVPCSGTGTLARNPEIKWRLRPADLTSFHRRQVELLGAALNNLAPGGRLVYSTCSLEKEENEDVVEEVLATRSGFRLLACGAELDRLLRGGELAWKDSASLTAGPFLRTLPGTHPCDGFFAALVERA
ncbi:MAG: transcription antitermination factor NusB [Terriglobales bacterium]